MTYTTQDATKDSKRSLGDYRARKFMQRYTLAVLLLLIVALPVLVLIKWRAGLSILAMLALTVGHTLYA